MLKTIFVLETSLEFWSGSIWTGAVWIAGLESESRVDSDKRGVKCVSGVRIKG